MEQALVDRVPVQEEVSVYALPAPVSEEARDEEEEWDDAAEGNMGMLDNRFFRKTLECRKREKQTLCRKLRHLLRLIDTLCKPETLLWTIERRMDRIYSQRTGRWRQRPLGYVSLSKLQRRSAPRS